MEITQPRGKVRRFSDEQLRECLDEGISLAEIGRRFQVSASAVSQRVKQLGLTTVSAVSAPEESRRHVRTTLDVMEQLALNATRANLLQDACDDWLRDAKDPSRYSLEPRASDVEVTYTVEVQTDSGYRTMRRKKPLDELLDDLEGRDDDGARFVRVERGEYKHADPRELILRTQQESRQTVALVADLQQRLMEQRALEAWRTAVLEEIRQESPDCARRIAERVRRSLTIGFAFEGAGRDPGGGPDRPGTGGG